MSYKPKSPPAIVEVHKQGLKRAWEQAAARPWPKPTKIVHSTDGNRSNNDS